MKTPRWVMEYAAQMQQALGLGPWELTFEVCEQPNPDNPASDAVVYPNPRYLEARLVFRASCMRKETGAGKALIIHELLHVVNSAHDRLTQQLIKAHAPQELCAHIEELLTDADERRVVLLSRALFYAFEPMQKTEKRKRRRR